MTASGPFVRIRKKFPPCNVRFTCYPPCHTQPAEAGGKEDTFMTRHTRHITTALLALCLLLTACGGKQTGGSPGRLSGTAAYTSDIAPLDLPLTELTASAAGSGDL